MINRRTITRLVHRRWKRISFDSADFKKLTDADKDKIKRDLEAEVKKSCVVLGYYPFNCKIERVDYDFNECFDAPFTTCFEATCSCIYVGKKKVLDESYCSRFSKINVNTSVIKWSELKLAKEYRGG